MTNQIMQKEVSLIPPTIPKEKVVYDEAMLKLAVEAREAGISGVSYEDFRKQREAEEAGCIEKLAELREELKDVMEENKHLGR